jgi:hypothetical protein
MEPEGEDGINAMLVNLRRPVLYFMSTPAINSRCNTFRGQQTPPALIALGGGFRQGELEELLTTTPRQGGGNLAVICHLLCFHSIRFHSCFTLYVPMHELIF